MRDDGGQFSDSCQSEADARDRRAYRRTRVLWGASLRCAGDEGTLSVTVANISAGGAKLVFAEYPNEAEAVVADQLDPDVATILMLPSIGEFPAKVVWCGRGRLGIKFTEPPEEVAAIIGPVIDLTPD
ncbi:PilZ domain-containing protein [Ferruginivarius sediminum]|uniref:PilZ domain-containing protein n=1 Tax=Ferruginivarius sediminum TaxID=2661937 RepID=UPI001379D150|nr:PilZ domain-containing protein [Ferruginivarius sediminum]